FSPCCFCDLPSNTPPTQIYTLSLHDALPIFLGSALGALFTLALSRLGSLVRLGVLLLELLQSGLLGLGARTRLLLALLLGFLGRLVGLTRAPVLAERHPEAEQQLEGLLVGLRGR